MRLPRIDIQSVQTLTRGAMSHFVKKAPQIDTKTFRDVYSITNCALSDFMNKTTSAAQNQNPKLFENVNGLLLPKKDTILRRFFEAGRDFFEIPLDVLSEIASKFPKSRLNNSQFLQNHRAHILAENELAALQGGRDIISDFAKEFSKKGIKTVPASIDGNCAGDCADKCNKISGHLNQLLNKTVEFGNSTFDTKKERFTTRIISGFTAAFFLGSDFFNKAKLKGKSDEEAIKAQHGKQGQEIKENLEEGVMQYLLNACCSEFVNNNMIAPVVSGLIIGTISRIHSRLSSGRPIKRVKTPEHSMTEFMRATKSGEQYKTQSEIDKQAKEPILSKKNLVKGCAFLVAAMYALRFASNTKVVKKLLAPLTDKMKQFELSNIEDIVATRADIDKFKGVLSKCDEGKYAEWIERAVSEAFEAGAAEVSLGTKYKTTKLLGLFEVKQKDLKLLPLAPFKFVTELVSYPYKLVNKIEIPIRKAFEKPVKTGIENIINSIRRLTGNTNEFKFKTPDFVEPLIKDNFKFKNVYLRYKEFEAKFGSDPDKLQEEFGKYLHDMRIASLNRKTSSKVDNTTVAAVSQITGSLAGIWFNMNDDYNAAIKNGENRAEARKAARLRGINKIARTTSQAAIWGTLKELFKKQCNGSITGSMIMVAISTVLTDMASRVLAAMPIGKMKTKEDIEAYQKNQKEGVMAWYHNGIDRLAS